MNSHSIDRRRLVLRLVGYGIISAFILFVFKPGPSAVARTPKVETGVVKWFRTDEGFGFITRQNGEDVFVYYSEITSADGAQTLRKDQKVSFELCRGPHGYQACHVVPE